jgi:hypothetical protein
MGQVPLSASIAPRLEIVAARRAPSSLSAPRSTHPRRGVMPRAASSRMLGLRASGTGWTCPDSPRSAFDERSDHVVAAPHPGIAADAVAELYWHSALPLVVQARGGEVLHASGVLMSRGVVALCGASKSGKSTIAYGLHRRGYRLWADDAVAVEVTEPAITALPLPFDVRLRPATAALFGLGEGAARLAGPVTRASRRDGLRRRSRPSASSGAGRRLRDACASEASEAYPALLANAHCFSLEDPARKRLMLDRYLSLVARVPVMALAVPDGLERLPAILDALERGVRRAQAGRAVTDTDRLLRILARGEVPADLEGRARGLIGNVVWSRLFDRAEAHGVVPLAARSLAALGWRDVPAPVRAAFEAARRINAARNALVARALGRVLEGLGRAGVPVIPLKGVGAVGVAVRRRGPPSVR